MKIDFNELAPLLPTMSNAMAMGYLWRDLEPVDRQRIISNSGLHFLVKPSDQWARLGHEHQKVLIAQWYLEFQSIFRIIKCWPAKLPGQISMMDEIKLTQ